MSGYEGIPVGFIPSFKGGILQCFGWEDSYGVWGRYQHPPGQEEREEDEQEVMMAMASDGCLDLRDSRLTSPS